jgi:CDP-paratose 2-epimerase
LSVDHTTHSLFGVSKLAADAMVQEYGRYFGMNTICFRGGCLIGPGHSGTMLHGFLSYLVKCAVTGPGTLSSATWGSRSATTSTRWTW